MCVAGEGWLRLSTGKDNKPGGMGAQDRAEACGAPSLPGTPCSAWLSLQVLSKQCHMQHTWEPLSKDGLGILNHTARVQRKDPSGATLGLVAGSAFPLLKPARQAQGQL